ncbi:hypothetical protein BLNAU_11399 [Blattamonas nauphoetae]|uniref:Right handed beta helix domain-containing protein n=1 Tax=Blattamonas nauphoetae TaxID=2049346 RepID=A0ABQ9XMR0_9EUKA|nr:hypothetical protein BLNAU_11399 [Blattamonas nauphoetae]
MTLLSSSLKSVSNHLSGSAISDMNSGGNLLIQNTSYISCTSNPPEIPTVDDESKHRFVGRTITTIHPFESISTGSIAFVNCIFRDFVSTDTMATHSIGIHAEPIDCPFIISACKFIDFSSSGPSSPAGCISIVGTSSLSSSVFIQNTLFENLSATGFGAYAGALRLLFLHSLTIDGCNLTSCSAQSNSGGIYIRKVTTLIELSNNRFLDCSAGEAAGGIRIREDSSFSITSTRFENCHAGKTAGGVDSYNGMSSISIVLSTFHTCTSDFDGGGLQLLFDNSSSINQDFTVSFDNCTFDSCSAANFGGGFYVTDDTSAQKVQVTVKKVIFRTCKSQDSGAAFFVDDCDSVDVEGCVVKDCVTDVMAAVRLYNITSTTIQSTHFANCSVDSKGGAGFALTAGDSLTIQTTNFIQMTSNGHGGGVRLFSLKQSITIKDCRILECVSELEGGAVLINSLDDATATVTLTRLTIIDCRSNTQNAGAIHVNNADFVNVSNCTVQGCSSSTHGGGLLMYFSNSSIVNQDFTVSIENCTFESCSAGSHGGGFRISDFTNAQKVQITVKDVVFRNCSCKVDGAAFYADDSSSANVKGCVVEDCSTDVLGAIRLYNIKTTSVESTRFNNCSGKDVAGAGFALTHTDLITIRSTNFTKMKSDHTFTLNDHTTLLSGNGGGARLLVRQATVTLEDCLFEECVSEQEAGALHIDGLSESQTAVTLTRLTIIDCHSNTQHAGGINVFDVGSLKVSGCVVQGCSCSTYGGALRVFHTPSLTITDSSFSSNFAATNGGSIDSWNISTSTLIQNCSFTDSNATGLGGGVVFNKTPNSEVRNCSFTQCRANRGAAVDVVVSNSLTLAQLVIRQCSAETVGGGIFFEPQSTEDEDPTVSVSEMTFGSKSDGTENSCGDGGVDLFVKLSLPDSSTLLTQLRDSLFPSKPTSGYAFAQEQRLSATAHLANTDPVLRTSILAHVHPYNEKEMFVDSVNGLDEPLCGLQILPCATLSRAGDTIPDNGTIRIRTKAQVEQPIRIERKTKWKTGDSSRVSVVFTKAGYVTIQNVEFVISNLVFTSSPSATLRTESLFTVTDGSLSIFSCDFRSIKSSKEGSCISMTLVSSGSLYIDSADFRSCSSSSNGGALFLSLSESIPPSSLDLRSFFYDCLSDEKGYCIFLEGYDLMTLLDDSYWNIYPQPEYDFHSDMLWGTDLSLPSDHRFRDVSLWVYLDRLVSDTIFVNYDGRDVIGCGWRKWPCASIFMAALLPIDEKHITIHILDTIDLYDEVDFDERNVRIEGYSSISSVSLRKYAQICVEKHDLVLTHLRFTGTYRG